MAYNRYQGNSGRRERMEEPGDAQKLAPEAPAETAPQEKTPPEALRSLRSGLDGLLGRLDPARLESEDLLVLAILWLRYRSCGDKELLLTMALYLLL